MPDLANELPLAQLSGDGAEDLIVVLGTGGTIAGTAATADAAVDYRAAVLPVERLVASIPSLAGLPLRIEQLAQIDSKDMSQAVWRRLAVRCAMLLEQPRVRGIVVAHGSDTVEETAFFLQRVLAQSTAKPVVLTCAMRPSTHLGADGPQNLADAVAVAGAPGAAGVSMVCAGRIHDPEQVAKAHAYRLDAFESGDAGPVGFVEDGRVRLVRPWPAAAALCDPRSLPEAAWPWVEILTSHADARGAVVHRLLDAGIAGIVAAGTGNGSLHAALEAALLEAQARGVAVLRSTRCAFGRVAPGRDDRLPSTALNPAKARIALQLQLLAAA